ncbi:MAG: T9SS type A sorting domain-containing protein, partial [Ignavibacteriae bacterium]|nr:T9SS type A sorting domain-containing protein [Ignavibacteriota bacterium]
VGTNPAPLTTLTLTSGGQFDSCLSGTATASAKIATGYNLSTGTSSFTISFWLNDPVTPASTRYLFGDAGFSFRCFVGGVAPASGAVLRGTGVTDVPIRNILPGPSVVHIVYDSASSSVKVYKNGVLDTTVAQTPFNFNAGTGFSVGGYTTSAGLEGLMDEFRFYKRALNQAEITATWNQNLGVITNITPVQTETPKDYKLSQNYPNPFNPATKIGFSIPKSGLTTLKVYDVLGKEIAVLVNETKSAGSYIVDFNASSLSTGVYYYRLEANGFIDTKKLTLIK